MSETYACAACTYVQSKRIPSCELCQTPNPNFDDQEDLASLQVVSGLISRYDKGYQECRYCQYINVGHNLRVCENCGSHFKSLEDLLRKLRFARDAAEEVPATADSEGSEERLADVEEEEEEQGMGDEELTAYYKRYIALVNDQRQQTNLFTEEQLKQFITELFRSVDYEPGEPDDELVFTSCQICCDEDQPLVTMKICGHRLICRDDFHQYLSLRIRDRDLLPWISCPAANCSMPCHVDNIFHDAHLTCEELFNFVSTFMLKKLARHRNFVNCAHCDPGGFLQLCTARKQRVSCPVCDKEQIIEKGVNGQLDDSFQEMIRSGQLRACPACRHWTFKEKGICNVIECAKCGVWWNWKTKEQGRNGKDLKRKARESGTLWEPGELYYQLELQKKNPEEFKALLERNGIEYKPNYVRGHWDDE